MAAQFGTGRQCLGGWIGLAQLVAAHNANGNSLIGGGLGAATAGD